VIVLKRAFIDAPPDILTLRQINRAALARHPDARTFAVRASRNGPPKAGNGTRATSSVHSQTS
jgi:hypothetical protein